MDRHQASWAGSVEALRGVAVLLVFSSHALGHWTELSGAYSTLLSSLYSLVLQLDFGRLGVYVFFLISGFLIPFSVKGSGTQPAIHFLHRRFLRVAPLFFLSIPLGLVLEHWLQGGSVSLGLAILNIFLIPNFSGYPFALNAYWTLQIEMVFYLFIYAMAVRVNIKGSRFALSGAFVLTMILAELARPEKYDLEEDLVVVLGEFAKILGGLTFIWVGSLIRKWLDRRASSLELLLLGTYCAYAFIFLPLKSLGKVNLSEQFSTLSFLVPAMALLLFCLVILKKFRFAGLERLGEVSYSMYLMHAPVIYIVKYAFFLVLEFSQLGPIFLTSPISTLSVGVIFIVLTFYGSLALSCWTYNHVERRFWVPSELGKTKQATT